MSLTSGLVTGLTSGLTSGLTGAGGTTPWTPSDLSSLIGWWDAQDSATIATADAANRVSSWSDKSGNAHTLSNSTALNQPETGVQTINGYNALGFNQNFVAYLTLDGTLTDSTDIMNAQDFHIAIVFEDNGVDSVQRQGALVHVKSTNGSDLFNANFGTSTRPYLPENTGGSTSYLIGGLNDFPLNTPALLSMDGDASNMIAYNTGTQIAATGAGATSDHFDRFHVGYRTTSSRAYTGKIGEIVVAQSLSTADRQALEGYLANKWGL